MKKYSIFISVFLVFFSFNLNSFAQMTGTSTAPFMSSPTKNDTPRVKLNLPTLDIIVSDNNVLITLNGVSDKINDFEIYGFPEFSGPVVNSYLKKSDGEKVIWDIENVPKGNYFVYAIKKDNLNPSGIGTISTKTSIVNIGGASPDLSLIYKWPLDYKIAQKNVIVSGKIDQNKYPYANESLKIRFKRSKDISKVGNSEDIYIAKIEDNGSYSAEISGLDPKSKYFLQQEILGGNPEVVLDTRLDRDSTFNSKDGNVLASSEEFSKNFDKRSYRLLAPWPGLSVVLDPSLCAEEKAAGRLDSNAICDINGLLNYLFKLLIGLTAVSLVLRIMFEGYQYIVTDIPFLKSSAKSHLSESFFGLVLALSAWMLLNTINPKLVSNSLNIKSVEVGLSDELLEGEGETTIAGKVVSVTKSKIKYSKPYTNKTACPGTGGTRYSPNFSTCIKYPQDILRSASGYYLEKDFSEKLNSFYQTLNKKNIAWRITEAWPGSREHKSTCHQIGVCIDMNHTKNLNPNPNPTIEQVKIVIETAASLGMCAQYEILSDKKLNNELITAGLGKNVIFFNGKHISANHYSLYNGTCI